MKSKIYLCIMNFFVTIIFLNCTSPLTRHYDFSLKNTLSIFLLKNDNCYYFCIPVQYMGDYQIEKFEFDSGYVQIGNFEILLKRDEVNISVYLNEAADESEFSYKDSDDAFNLIYSEEKSKILISKMNEPLTKRHESDGKVNHYYIFIEKFLNNNEIKKITNEYEKRNVYSKMYIEYDITIDNEEQTGSGIYDDFELYDGLAIAPALFPANLNFFKDRYLPQTP